MRIYELRDPNRSYSKLDNLYRNQYQQRRKSTQVPQQYDYDSKDMEQFEVPTNDTETPEKIKQKAIEKSKQKKNQPTQVHPGFDGTLNNMSYNDIIKYINDPLVREFIDGFQHILGENFLTHYRVANWKQSDNTIKAPISAYITTDNDAVLELIMDANARKKKEVNEIPFDRIRMPKFLSTDKQEKVKKILSMPEYGGYEFLDNKKFVDIVIKDPQNPQANLTVNLDDATKQLLKLAEVIESMGSKFETPTIKKEKTPTSEHPYDYYDWLAGNLFKSWLNGVPSAFSRGGGETKGAYDLKDDMIVVGITKGGMYVRDVLHRNPYREHAVPCNLINNIGIDICENMFGEYKKKYADKKSIANNPKFLKEARRTLFVLKQMIQKCLVLVLCSTSERKYIDHTKGWLTTMPSKDWDWKTGNVLERFIKAKIPVFHIDNQEQRLAETK
jgi:hypothetical protein